MKKNLLISSLILTVAMSATALIGTSSKLAKAEETQENKYELPTSAVFSEELPEYVKYPHDNQDGDFGYGYNFNIYGDYSAGRFFFSEDDFKSLTVGDFANTGVGSFKDQKVEPFVTIYWSQANIGSVNTDYWSLGIGDRGVIDGNGELFLSIVFEKEGTIALITNNEEVVYDENGNPASSGGYVTEYAPRFDIKSFYQGSTEKEEYNVFRMYVDYAASKVYFANGEDASLENGKLFEVEVDWSAYGDRKIEHARMIPFTITNRLEGVSFMLKEVCGKEPVNAYLAMYGKVKEKYLKDTVFTAISGEYCLNNVFYSFSSYLILPDGSKVNLDEDGYSLVTAGNYKYGIEDTKDGVTYYKEFDFSVVEVTTVTVVAPTISVTSIDKAEALPALTGTTTGGVYRWKTNQTLTVGTNAYEWEFVPFTQDETVVYENTSGTIDVTVTDATAVKPNTEKKKGCKSNVGGIGMLSLLLLAGATIIKKSTNK